MGEGAALAARLRANVRLDTERAEALPGVHAIATHRDVPQNVVGQLDFLGVPADEPLLAEDEVRDAGQPIAVVAAESETIAAEAVNLIDVVYEPRAPFLDVRRAWDRDQPQVTAEGNVFHYYPDQPQRQVRKGDVERAFADADVIVEGVYRPAAIEQAPVEPQGAIAHVEPDGRITIHSMTQAMYFSMRVTAKHLKVSMSALKFVGGTVGGGFGGKVDTQIEPVVAVLARKAAGRSSGASRARRRCSLPRRERPGTSRSRTRCPATAGCSAGGR